jgi:hypothetical protein
MGACLKANNTNLKVNQIVSNSITKDSTSLPIGEIPGFKYIESIYSLYARQRLLGEGNFGIVDLCTHKETN